MSPDEKESPPEAKKTAKAEKSERPPQEEELLCTICGMPSCWREAKP